MSGFDQREFDALIARLREHGTLALFSDCGHFRYLLGRAWSATGPLLVFLMLNPSMATAEITDPTVKRCIERARLLGYGGVLVINLFAFITPYPWVMKEAASNGVDVVGVPVNDAMILAAARTGAAVVAAWGASGDFGDRAKAVIASLRAAGVQLKCLGTTKDGHPRHPLYLSYDIPLEEFARD